MTGLAKAHPTMEGETDFLEKSEERFRNLTAAAFEGIGMSLDGKVLMVNEQLADMFGYEQKELAGFPALQMVAPESRSIAADSIKSDREGRYEVVALRKDGSTFEAEVSVRLMLWRGETVRLTAVRDITERKKAERQLRQSEERFQLAVRGSTDGLWDWNVVTNEVFFADRVRELLGYTPEEFPNKFESFQSHLHPEDHDRVLKSLGTHLRDRTHYDSEYRLRTKAGIYRWFRARAQAIWDGNGRATRMAGSITDVTDQKRAREDLNRQLAFADVMTRVLAGFATCDAPGIDAAVVKGLQAIAEFVGADHAYVCIISDDRKARSATHEWCGPNVEPQLPKYQNVPFGYKPWSEANILAGEIICINSLADYPADAELDRQRDKKEGAISLLSVPIRGEAGRITGAVGLHGHAHPLKWSEADVACLRMVGDAIASLLERKRAEESLHRVSRRLHLAQDEERRRVARELHDSTAQELAAVMMNLETLEDLIPEAKEKVARLLRDSAGLVERCSEEIRTLAYLLHPPLLDQMGLEPALRSYVEGYSRRSGIAVKLDIALEGNRFSPEVELTLFRVVQEALGNIHRHSGSRTASICVSRQPREVCLEIKDEGKGIPPENVRAFRRGLAAAGVGLAAMQERLRGVNGRLEIENANPGTFLRAVVRLND